MRVLMAAPVFPFERPLRDGKMVRDIMCRACARWTAWDGVVWRHTDGTEACVNPATVWGQHPTKPNPTGS